MLPRELGGSVKGSFYSLELVPTVLGCWAGVSLGLGSGILILSRFPSPKGGRLVCSVLLVLLWFGDTPRYSGADS